METLQRTANRGSVSTGYDIDNSCKFNSASSEAITTTNQAAGNQKTWTWSGWIKRTNDSTSVAEHLFGAGGAYLRFVSGETLNVQQNGSSLTTNQVFRDNAAWFHLVWILDTTQSTEADRSRIYINGSRITSFSSASYPSLNADLDVGGQSGSSNWLQLGRWYAGGRAFNGYMAEIHYLNGTVAEPSNFGETDSDSGIWIPKEYTGSGYGTQGYYYKFDDSSNMGKDSSGEGHDANSVENITAADQATDTPTNLFATFNPLYLTVGTYPEGATKYTTNAYGGWKSVYPTMGAESGKWYAEFKHVDSAGSKFIGVVPFSLPGLPRGEAGFSYYGSTSNSIGYFNDGNRYINASASSYGATWNNSDIMSIALDMDNGKVYFAKNGTWQNSGDPTSGSTGTGAIDLIEPTQAHAFGPSLYDANTSMLCNYGGYTTISISSGASDANGHGTFEYAPPSGYFALCTKNLAELG